MFNYDDTIRKLDKISDMPHRKAKRYLGNLVTDEEFLKWAFMPSDTQPVSVEQFNTLQSYLISTKSIRILVNAIEDMEFDVDRSVATYLNNLCTIALDASNEQSQLLDKERKAGTLSGKELRKMQDKLESYHDDIEELASVAKKIVKREVRNLSRDCGLGKNICRLGYWYVPAPKYIAKYRIGRFLRYLLGAIYDEVANNGFPETRQVVRWKTFFKAIFGKDNVYSVATFILLEGVGHIDKYRGSNDLQAVRYCWDSLTEYALSELEDAPDEMRDQMIELYIKRIDRQFRNKRTDLRIDILKLPSQFKQLAKTVERYYDRISKIMELATNKN